jgi:hypothetical protein
MSARKWYQCIIFETKTLHFVEPLPVFSIRNGPILLNLNSLWFCWPTRGMITQKALSMSRGLSPSYAAFIAFHFRVPTSGFRLQHFRVH